MHTVTFTLDEDGRTAGVCTCGYSAIGGDPADVEANLAGHDHNDVPPPEV